MIEAQEHESANHSSSSFTSLTWNLEGLFRNIFHLKHFTNNINPDIICIGEPQIFQHDLNIVMKPLQGEYKWSLNSADKHDPDLPFVKSKAHGGTMIMWRLCHDPYITVHSLASSSILPVIFAPPGHPVSIHVSVYLPTHRDFNVSDRNTKRKGTS